MTKAVLDASAIIKWFVSEDETKECKKLRDMHLKGRLKLYTCRFTLIELSNALRFAAGITAEDIINAVKAVEALNLALIDEHEVLDEAIKIAFKYEITVHDAIYVALSRKLNSRLVTYDEELLRKFPDEAVRASKLLKQ